MMHFGQFHGGILVLFFHFAFDFTSLHIQSTFEDPLKCFPFLGNQLPVVSVHQKELFVFFEQHTCPLYRSKLRIARNQILVLLQRRTRMIKMLIILFS